MPLYEYGVCKDDCKRRGGKIQIVLMKRLCLALVVLAQAVALTVPASEFSTAEQGFKFERYDSQNDALHQSRGGTYDDYDNFVQTVFVDSEKRVWVGTLTGLAVYDGKQWTNTTFRASEPLALRVSLSVLSVSSRCGPNHIAEGPPGTIWLGGDFGVSRFRNGRYESISSSSEIAGMLDMALDREGGLWVVQKLRVSRFDGQTWSTVLCPYIGKPKSYEAPGLRNIAIGTHGSVWIGATAYREPSEPWVHVSPIWVVDQAHRKRNGGPPMAPLFEFDGKGWKAFGPPHGLDAFYRTKGNRAAGGTPRGWAIPMLDESGRIRVATPNGHYIREGKLWKPVKQFDAFASKRWVLEEHKKGSSKRGLELLFRDGEHLVEVHPANAQTGEILELGSERIVSLKIAEDPTRGSVWLGTRHGLYRIWLDDEKR